MVDGITDPFNRKAEAEARRLQELKKRFPDPERLAAALRVDQQAARLHTESRERLERQLGKLHDEPEPAYRPKGASAPSKEPKRREAREAAEKREKWIEAAHKSELEKLDRKAAPEPKKTSEATKMGSKIDDRIDRDLAGNNPNKHSAHQPGSVRQKANQARTVIKDNQRAQLADQATRHKQQHKDLDAQLKARDELKIEALQREVGNLRGKQGASRGFVAQRIYLMREASSDKGRAAELEKSLTEIKEKQNEDRSILQHRQDREHDNLVERHREQTETMERADLDAAFEAERALPAWTAEEREAAIAAISADRASRDARDLFNEISPGRTLGPD